MLQQHHNTVQYHVEAGKVTYTYVYIMLPGYPVMYGVVYTLYSTLGLVTSHTVSPVVWITCHHQTKTPNGVGETGYSDIRSLRNLEGALRSTCTPSPKDGQGIQPSASGRCHLCITLECGITT